MIYLACVSLYAIQSERMTSGVSGVVLAVALIAVALLVTWFYIINKNAMFHEVAFGVLVWDCIITASHTEPTTGFGGDQPGLVPRAQLPRAQQDIYRQVLLGQLLGRHVLAAAFISSAYSFATGITAFVLWNIDNMYCHHVRDLRGQLGVLGFMAQLHAWQVAFNRIRLINQGVLCCRWHFGNAVQGYVHVTMRCVRNCHRDLKRSYGVCSMMLRAEDAKLPYAVKV